MAESDKLIEVFLEETFANANTVQGKKVAVANEQKMLVTPPAARVVYAREPASIHVVFDYYPAHLTGFHFFANCAGCGMMSCLSFLCVCASGHDLQSLRRTF